MGNYVGYIFLFLTLFSHSEILSSKGIRYIKLKYDEARAACIQTAPERIEFFKKQVKKVPKRDLSLDAAFQKWQKTHRVYISLTTTPFRIHSIHHVLETLDLTHVEQILLSIPKIFSRTATGYEIPESLLQMPKVTLLQPEIDEGPVSKMLTAAEYLRSRDPAAVLITLDDDQAYPPGMVNELSYAAFLNPDAVLGARGHTFDHYGIHALQTVREGKKGERKGEIHFTPCDLLEGYAAIAYPVAQIPIELIRNFSQKCSHCFVSDDMVIALALEKTHILRMQIASRFYSYLDLRNFEYGEKGDALKFGGEIEKKAPKSVHPMNYRTVFDHLSPEIFSQ